jgi:sulfite reductase alpha subunit-like flavoprotein
MVRSGAPRTALLVLYGSETGNAHDVAERIAREATRRSYAATVRAMDAYDVTALPSAGRAVFVTSTMGQGDPPANVRAFWRFLLRKNLPANSLAGLAFACFGLGDSHYRQYNVVAKRLHKRLLGLGARSVADLGLGDDQHPSGYDAALDPWLETLWERMRDDVVTRDAPSAPPSARADPDADPEDERKFDAEILQQPPREEGGESRIRIRRRLGRDAGRRARPRPRRAPRGTRRPRPRRFEPRTVA